MAEKTDNLQKYEELFANRFTSEDHEYQQYRSRPQDLPPIVEEWRSRTGENYRGRDNRYQDRRGHRERGWGGGPGWGGDRDRDRGWGGDRDRDRGWGGDRDRGWGGDRDRGRGGDRDWRADHHRQQHRHDRDRDRDRNLGHGSGYQSDPPSSNQAYSSHHQRPHNDNYKPPL